MTFERIAYDSNEVIVYGIYVVLAAIIYSKLIAAYHEFNGFTVIASLIFIMSFNTSSLCCLY